MDKAAIISKLRVIFSDEIEAYEDHEFDDPEYLTGETLDFIIYRSTLDESMLHLAAGIGELEGAKLLVELGVEIDLIGDMGNTALHYAANKNHVDIYDYLVSKGANENVVNEFGKTPLQYKSCLLYTSPSPRDRTRPRMPSSA